MANQVDKGLGRSWREYAVKAGTFFMLGATHRWVRSLVMMIMAAVLVWLLFYNVWRPLAQEAKLPASVSEVDPSLEIQTLQAINTLRADRVRRQRPDYTIFSRILVPPEPNE